MVQTVKLIKNENPNLALKHNVILQIALNQTLQGTHVTCHNVTCPCDTFWTLVAPCASRII